MADGATQRSRRPPSGRRGSSRRHRSLATGDGEDGSVVELPSAQQLRDLRTAYFDPKQQQQQQSQRPRRPPAPPVQPSPLPSSADDVRSSNQPHAPSSSTRRRPPNPPADPPLATGGTREFDAAGYEYVFARPDRVDIRASEGRSVRPSNVRQGGRQERPKQRVERGERAEPGREKRSESGRDRRSDTGRDQRSGPRRDETADVDKRRSRRQEPYRSQTSPGQLQAQPPPAAKARPAPPKHRSSQPQTSAAVPERRTSIDSRALPTREEHPRRHGRRPEMDHRRHTEPSNTDIKEKFLDPRQEARPKHSHRASATSSATQRPTFMSWLFEKSKEGSKTSRRRETDRPLLSGTCVVCQEDCTYKEKPSRRSQGVLMRCGCVWCNACVRDIFRRSTEDRTLMPPQCCPASGEISRRRVLHIFYPHDEPLMKLWTRKYEEWKTDKGVTCPVRGCATYHSEGRTKAQDAGRGRPLVCRKCRTDICMRCRNIAHGSKPCPTEADGDPDEYAFDAFAAGQRWQQCPQCKIRVSKDEGCNHMTCICRAEFCFVCGRLWHSDGCRCPFYSAEDTAPPAMDMEDVRRFARHLEIQDLDVLFQQFRREFMYW